MEERKHEWFTQINEFGTFRCLKCKILRTPKSEKTPCVNVPEEFNKLFGDAFINDLF